LHASKNRWAVFFHLSDLAQQVLAHALRHEPVIRLPGNRMSHGLLRSPVGIPRRPPERVDDRGPRGNERLIAYSPSHDVTSCAADADADWEPAPPATLHLEHASGGIGRAGKASQGNHLPISESRFKGLSCPSRRIAWCPCRNGGAPGPDGHRITEGYQWRTRVAGRKPPVRPAGDHRMHSGTPSDLNNFASSSASRSATANSASNSRSLS
jgi:hypothetical protein